MRNGLCACGFDCKLEPTSAAWHRAHQAVHLIVFPRCDAVTRASLQTLVDLYERRELAKGAHAS